MPNVVLGISSFYHDSAAALLIDGDIVAAAHEERFTRIKHDSAFPHNAVRYVLEEASLDIAAVDVLAFYDKPLLKFERLLETYHSLAPKGLKSFLTAMPVWVKEKIFMRSMLRDELTKIGEGNPQLVFPEHHLSHAASAFFPSPFSEAAILTIDGVGEWATTTIGKGEGNSIEVLKELNFPHSLGLLYSAFTYYCGFKVNSGEYKLMGLAPYGHPHSRNTQRFKEGILQELIDVREDGSFLLNMDYFNYAVGLTMCHDDKWQELFGVPRRPSETVLEQVHMDMALAIQEVTEDIVFLLAETAKAAAGCANLVMAGGVALNCVANGKLLRRKTFDKIWIQPAAGDAGGSLGAAYAAWHIGLGKTRKAPIAGIDAMQGGYLGPEFSTRQIQRTAQKYRAPFQQFTDFDLLCREVAKLLAQGNVIGWFQGRMEFGPRALGNRSILGNPCDPAMQKKLNLKIKYREGFRPFAPSVLEEDSREYFDLDSPSPYMLLVAPVCASRCRSLPEDTGSLDIFSRLYQTRSDIPAVTHVDSSARIQTVSKETNLKYWTLLQHFKETTGYSLLVNTSFNVRGEPIVCSPEDALRCFMRTEMDYLVLGDNLFIKTKQPEWQDKDDWRGEFQLD